MQELDQTQELIQMLKERLNEKDETIATLQATIKNLEATVKMLQENAVDLKATIANLTETLNEFKRKFFGISSEKSKKKQTDEPVCEEASEQESGIPVRQRPVRSVRPLWWCSLYPAFPLSLLWGRQCMSVPRCPASRSSAKGWNGLTAAHITLLRCGIGLFPAGNGGKAGKRAAPFLRSYNQR